MRLGPGEEAALREIGQFNGRLYRRELAARIAQGTLDRTRQADYRADRKRALTAETSSRWAGAITRSVEDQYQSGMRALAAHARSLDSAVATLAARCTLAPNERDGKVAGYRDTAERFAKTRRLAALRVVAERARRNLAEGRPSIVVGGKQLWRNRNHLADVPMSEAGWRQQWDAARMFLTADGEAGKVGGNETIRVAPETRRLRVKVPAALADRFGTHLEIAAPVTFCHRSTEWTGRIAARQAVRYDIVFDPTRDRWYLDASWSLAPTPTVPLTAIRTGPVLGVDLNAGHLAICVLDRYGNPVGEPATIALPGHGLSSSRRDGHLRAALTALCDQAVLTGCTAIVIEDLDFADARGTGRETMGRGRRGKRFRRVVATIPTRRFRERLRAIATRLDIAVVAVDPAYTSKVGAKHWRTPLQEQTQTSDRAVTVHHGAAVAIGRRGLGVKLSRHSSGPRHAQRSVAGQPPSLARATAQRRVACEKPCPALDPLGRPDRSGSKHHTPAAKTVRAATERYPLSLTD